MCDARVGQCRDTKISTGFRLFSAPLQDEVSWGVCIHFSVALILLVRATSGRQRVNAC